MFDPTLASKFGKKADDRPLNGSALPTIDHLSEGHLVLLRDRIDARLPPARLSNLNLEEELVLQLMRAKALQSDAFDDVDVAANQKAQVMNSVASTIGALVRMQTDLYNAERFKAIEAILLEAVKSMPTPQATKFLDEYERLASS